MVDFLQIGTRIKKNVKVFYPKFIIKRSKDLMVRGGDFYAIWLEEEKRWSTDEQDLIREVDRELDKAAERYIKDNPNDGYQILYLRDSENGMMDHYLKYVKKHMRDDYHQLDEQLVWSNGEPRKDDYASRRLPYPLQEGSIENWDELISTLYEPPERHKIEWSIGAIVSGDSKTIQKFCVLYGAAGTGKSTILNIIQDLFNGYYCVFDAKALGNSNSSFALEPFKNNPLVAIQHDGDLSKIEDNTRLNSIVSHEEMTVNEKFKSVYTNRFKCFLFMGTNKPVRITDAKSGLIRRLIDIKPSGNKIAKTKYTALTKGVQFELGAIANHCLQVYKEDPGYYDSYIPTDMMGASNDFYNFVMDNFFSFEKSDGISLKEAWELYKIYCEETNILYPFSQRVFKEELKTYFKNFDDRYTLEDGSRIRSYYSGFMVNQFEVKDVSENNGWLKFNCTKSLLDKVCEECLAQLANNDGVPSKKWSDVTSTLKDIDTSKLHYLRLPLHHIVVDFDIPNDDGEKDLKKNMQAANQFPKTYAELSKSGNGIHLHYFYLGDPTQLANKFPDNKHIEIKVFKGNSSLRRMLTKCNNIEIASISSGLPLKERSEDVIEFKAFKNDKAIRNMIEKNLNKEYHPGTKPSIDFIAKILDDAYKSGMTYDISDMKPKVLKFAAKSTHQSEYCVKAVNKMKWCSDDVELGVQEPPSKTTGTKINKFLFYDVEVYPNLFVLCYKIQGEDFVTSLVNPEPKDITPLLDYKLVGFNNRRYDNHIIYARMLGYTNEELYELSQRIINGDKSNRQTPFFPNAYGISETDIYDFASSYNKMSLKKLEIVMGVHHQEMNIPWDQPVPKEMIPKVVEYCKNDVIATEKAFEYLKEDWTTRKMLADIAGATPNDTTNALTTKIIFQGNRNPQTQFKYRDLSQPVHQLTEEEHEFLSEVFPVMMSQTHGKDGSLLPYFPGYEFDKGKSTYKGREVGEGGYVYAEPGIYYDVALLDVTSMHPHSIIAEILFGVYYTRRFKDLVYGRVDIKHGEYDKVKEVLDGKIAPYVEDILSGKLVSGALALALKTPINSTYGLTSAKFDNPFKDKRNIDNIVAKRGALFMIDLEDAVKAKGYTVAHIKTDSIKIPNADKEIIDFVFEFGEKYGYYFEHEATYEKMCLVNDAVYIAKYKDTENHKHNGWTATGTQFKVPFVFKSLFSHEDIEFKDLCETKSVQNAMYLDMNEDLPDVSAEEKELKKAETKYKHGELSDTSFKKICDDLIPKIAKGHKYIFVGKVGSFCPVEEGAGGGLLMREKDGKYYAVGGTKGYRWLEAEVVKEMGLEDKIDLSYYEKLAEEASVDIASYYMDEKDTYFIEYGDATIMIEEKEK